VSSLSDGKKRGLISIKKSNGKYVSLFEGRVSGESAAHERDSSVRRRVQDGEKCICSGLFLGYLYCQGEGKEDLEKNLPREEAG